MTKLVGQYYRTFENVFFFWKIYIFKMRFCWCFFFENVKNGNDLNKHKSFEFQWTKDKIGVCFVWIYVDIIGLRFIIFFSWSIEFDDQHHIHSIIYRRTKKIEHIYSSWTQSISCVNRPAFLRLSNMGIFCFIFVYRWRQRRRNEKKNK